MKYTRLFLLSALFLSAFILPVNSVHATKWTVNVQNFSFNPSNLPNVNVGDTIRWVWVSGSHTTTSSSIPGGAASWDEPITSSITFYEYRVTVAGTYNYVCTPHAGGGMVGSFTASPATPVLTSISPNQALQGASFQATITGSNTNFTGTPSVTLSYSTNPGEVITATNVTVISSTVLHAQFTIPVAASPGLWDLHVNALLLEDAFTVIQAVPAILSFTPNSAEQGASFTGTVNGQYTNWTGTPSVYLSYSGNPSEIITGSNVTVVNGTQLTALFAIPSDASPGLYAVHVDALQLANAFTVIEVVPAIQFMSPNFAHQGDSFTASVFGDNTSWSGTPSVSLSYSLNPSEIITGTNVNVVSNTEITVDFSVAANASTGNYTLHVDDLTQSNAFTVLATLIPALSSISPDNGEQGTLVSTTVTGENTTFTSGNPSVSISLHSNPSEIINAQDVSVVNNTTLSADFDIPINATPGLWDLHVDDLLLENAFTVIDAVPFLVSIDPNSAYQGQQVSSLVTAVNTAFTLSAPSISLSFSGNPEEIISASSVNVLSDTEAEAVFDIPADALVGTYDLHVDDLVLVGSFTVNLLIGIGETVTQSIRMYPNPASQDYFIENATGADVNIFDASGKTIEGFKINSDKQALDVSHLTRGVYFIRVMVNGKAETIKLIVN